MQIVRIQDVNIRDVPGKARDGTWKRGVMMRGTPGSAGDFRMIIIYENGSKTTPRHRHNFDQFRFQLEGEVDFGESGKMYPGVLGYFPEGAYYGPTSAPDPNAFVSVQFGGPSGSGFITDTEHEAAHEALKQIGRFEKGAFLRNPGVPGKKMQDGFEAAWELAKGQPVVYPAPQYDKPILMDIGRGHWSNLPGVPGIAEKALGTFTNCKIRTGLYRLTPGSSLSARGRGIFLVLKGNGKVESTPFDALTTVHLEDREEAMFRAEEDVEILLMGLPASDLIATQLPQSASELMPG